MESKAFIPRMLVFMVMFNFLPSSLGATDFCREPLGMKRRIILDEQIMESSVLMNLQTRKGFNARLDNPECWCSHTSSQSNQWVKVDLRYPMSIRGIKIQGDRGYPPNYIKKFRLRYSTDGTNFLYKTSDVDGLAEEFDGATGQHQTIVRMFTTKPFAARYFEFRPTQFNGNDVCVRFELYGCAYVCNQGLGFEHGSALPSVFTMTSSSNQNGKLASSARLNNPSSCWCALTNNANQYLQIDFGKQLTITGLAVQGNPTADSWVKDFYFEYGMSVGSLATYQEYGTNKLFVGNVDRSTKVVNWFKVKLFARYARIKPNTSNQGICMRVEIIGCNSDFVYEIGAENRALDNSRFRASGHTAWTIGRYDALDGRLNNDRPWGISKSVTNPWFKVDLGRVMLVNGISIQGDGTYGANYYPDYKLQYSFDAAPAAGTLIAIKEETMSSEKIFTGNTNNAGVKFNLLTSPISTRHVLFKKNTNPNNDYALRVEIYGRPQTCVTSFGMEAGSQSTYNPIVQVSSGPIPADRAKLNSRTAWCAGVDNTNQYFEYKFGGIRTISGFAIQGHPVDLKWVKTFNVEYKELQSQAFTTYQEVGANKAFVGCTSRNLIVYHWFSSNLRMRYLRIKPLTWNTNICLRLNAYGCPADDCFNELGISSNTVGDGLLSSSTHVSSREASKGRLNMESLWVACQVGSCSPKESNGAKSWIQVCLSSVHKVASVIVQGPGNFDNIAKVTEFSLSFSKSSSGVFTSYSLDGSVKKFAVSIGRYTSSQIDLPFAIVSKCIRLQVESQSSLNQNVGLRWELLGCTTIPQPSSITITPASPSIAKGGNTVLSCTANALPGAEITWKKGSNVLSTGGIYEIGTATYSNDNINFKVAMTLKITATASTVVATFQNCMLTSSSQGLAECKQSYECSVVNGGVSSSARSSTTEVTVTGFQAKPTKPTGLLHSSLTISSFSVTWTAATADFAIKDYKVVLKKKADNSVIHTAPNITSTSASFSGLETFTSYIVEISAQTRFNIFSEAATLEVTTDQGVPTVPLSLSVTAVSATSIQLTWNQPSSLNGALHDYRIRYKLSSDSNFGTPISAGTQLTYNVTGLKPFTDYELQVQATTKGGINEGPWTLSILNKTQEGASTAPLNVSATAISATSIRLVWNQPASFNGILHDYKVRFKLTSNSTYSTSINAGTEMAYTVNGLRPFAYYELQVHASTKGGMILGEWSSSVESRTLEGLPSEPQNLIVLETRAENVLIRWAKPMIVNGILRSYMIRLTGSKTYNLSFTQRRDVTVQHNASSNSTSSVVRNLVPGTVYRIEVAATTGGGTGSFSPIVTVATPFAAPPKPTLQDQGVSKSVRKLLLGESSDRNGPISKYQLFIVEGQAQPCLPNGLNETMSPSKLPLTLEVEAGVTSIKGISLEMGTIGYFSFCYYAVVQEKDQSLVSEATTLAIERKSLAKVDPSPYNSTIKEDSFVIPLVKGPSNTKSYHVIVVENSASVKAPQEWLPSELGPYDEATYRVGKPYVAAVLSSYVSSFSVGDGKDYFSSNRRRRNVGSVTYKNAPLKANTDYLVFQRAYVSQSVYYSSPWIGPLKTKQASSPTSTPPPPIGLIVGVVVAVVIILALSILVFVIYRKRKAPGKEAGPHKKPIMMTPIAQSSDNASYNDDEDEATNVEPSPAPPARTHSILERRRSSNSSLRHKKAPRSVGHDSRHPPISLEDFARHSKDLQKDSHHGITVEYEDLGKGQQYTWDIAVNANNKKKNRYANIAAYDHSRVKLNPIRGVPHSDYFNANYISGYEKDAVYIASQGPIDSVLGDFWRMIWDANVSAIVMLTNLVERGKKKCSQYWPDMGSVEFEEVTVNLISVESYVDYTIRCFSITRSGFKESRTVYQFHYTTWPDHGIPESPTDLLNLQRKLRKTFPFSLDSPIVIHCSAGVGRTGTFIVIDAMLHLLRSQRKIDVFNYLNFIRTQRIHMVQVEEQYLFIYKALLESVTCGMTEIETQNLRIKINQLSSKEKSNQTGFDRQFQRLMMVTPHFNEKETTTALSKSNEVRNRKSSIVPREINRVILQQSIYENDGSTDYINALYVNGYKRKNAFIATQHPLPNTINDFWAMIYQANVATLVLLNKAQAGKENLPVFWSEVEQETVFGNTVVRSEQEQATADSVERDFVVSHRDSRANERYVKMFQFAHWPDHSVPKECGKLLSLINKVERCQQQQNEDQPIVVMCSDGAGRTGTFIAINILLERFKTEQLIDVFQTIKKIRAFRPEFVENALQYKFCHSIVQEYMESFDAYSNFNG